MPKKLTKIQALRVRFARRLDSYMIPTHRLSEQEARERCLQMAFMGYSMAENDGYTKRRKKTQHTVRGVELCKTCGNSPTSYAHEEICGI